MTSGIAMIAFENASMPERGPHAARMEVQRGYLSVLRLATAKPDDEDRPGEIVSNARRKRGGPGF
jgi:hypothetical protein